MDRLQWSECRGAPKDTVTIDQSDAFTLHGHQLLRAPVDIFKSGKEMLIMERYEYLLWMIHSSHAQRVLLSCH